MNEPGRPAEVAAIEYEAEEVEQAVEAESVEVGIDAPAPWEYDEPLMLPEGSTEEEIEPLELPEQPQEPFPVESEIPDEDPDMGGVDFVTEPAKRGRKPKKAA